MGLLQSSMQNTNYQEYQEKEAMARFKSSKGKDMVLLLGDKVEVFKRAHAVPEADLNEKGHGTAVGKPYQPLGTPRKLQSIAKRFVFPVLNPRKSNAKAPPRRREEPPPDEAAAADKYQVDEPSPLKRPISLKSRRAHELSMSSRLDKVDTGSDPGKSDGDEDPVASALNMLQARYGNVDFYGRQDYLRRKEQQKAQLRSDQNSDDADAEKAGPDREASKKKKAHDRWRKLMQEADGTQGKFRQRHHRNYCPFHPDNVMQKYTDDTSKMTRCRFAYSELRDTQKRVGMASNGASFVAGLDPDIDLDVIFRKLTVEDTLERKRSKKDVGAASGDAKSLIFITGADVDEARDGAAESEDSDMDLAEELGMDDFQAVKKGTSKRRSPSPSPPSFTPVSSNAVTPELSDLGDTHGQAMANVSDLTEDLGRSMGPLDPLMSSISLVRSYVSTTDMQQLRPKDADPEPEAEDDACICTPRSTDSDEYRDASSVVDAWKTAFKRMKFQMNSTLDVAMLARRENREKVYKSKAHLNNISQNACKVAGSWQKTRFYPPSMQSTHPRVKKNLLRRLERQQMRQDQHKDAGDARRESGEKWTPFADPEVILRRSNPLDRDKKVKLDDREALPLRDATISHPPSVWSSIWSTSHAERETAASNMKSCVELYTQVIEFCRKISYPNNQYQEQFLSHLRDTLTQGCAVGPHILFDQLLVFDRACIESREVMKLVHFVREALGITPRQFFDWLHEQNWKLTVELKNLKTRLVNERKL